MREILYNLIDRLSIREFFSRIKSVIISVNLINLCFNHHFSLFSLHIYSQLFRFIICQIFPTLVSLTTARMGEELMKYFHLIPLASNLLLNNSETRFKTSGTSITLWSDFLHLRILHLTTLQLQALTQESDSLTAVDMTNQWVHNDFPESLKMHSKSITRIFSTTIPHSWQV